MALSQIHRAQATVYTVNPLEDLRWGDFVRKAERSSVFHTHGWLEALHRTYGYEPVIFTTSPPLAAIENGIVFCRVDSWLTGNRLVSLPFAEHCQPLGGDSEEIQLLLSAARQEVQIRKLEYMEIRPMRPVNLHASHLHSSKSYSFHQIDLEPNLATLFGHCHKSSTQRKIRRAEREELRYEEGRSKELLDSFYQLLLLTRRRHRIPPQPKKWFENLVDCLGESLKIRVAFKDEQPIAAIITLSHKHTLFYKYGCSDSHFHNLGAMHLLLWRSIEEAKEHRMNVFDLGRSETGNLGLIRFKKHWGSTSSTVTYSRYSAARGSVYRSGWAWKEQVAKKFVASLPTPLFQLVGETLYKHIG